jgi:hypothetical protein
MFPRYVDFEAWAKEGFEIAAKIAYSNKRLRESTR